MLHTCLEIQLSFECEKKITIPPVISFPVVFRLKGICLFQHPLPTVEIRLSLRKAYQFLWTTLGLPSLTSVRYEWVRSSLYAGRYMGWTAYAIRYILSHLHQ